MHVCQLKPGEIGQSFFVEPRICFPEVVSERGSDEVEEKPERATPQLEFYGILYMRDCSYNHNTTATTSSVGIPADIHRSFCSPSY